MKSEPCVVCGKIHQPVPLSVKAKGFDEAKLADRRVGAIQTMIIKCGVLNQLELKKSLQGHLDYILYEEKKAA